MERKNKQEYLEHFGVRGMKWGVRRNVITGKINPKTVGKKVYFSDNFDPLPTAKGHEGYFTNRNEKVFKTFKKASPKIRAAIKQINNSDEFRDVNVNLDHEARFYYDNKVSKAVTKQLNAAGRLYGKDSAVLSEYRLEFKYDVNKNLMPEAVVTRTTNNWLARYGERRYAKKVRSRILHESGDETTEFTNIKLEIDDLGHITNIIFPEEIEHAGVKGMKWGVRKAKKSSGKFNIIRKNGKLILQKTIEKAKERMEKPVDSEYLDSSILRRTPLSQLSNDDINRLTKRMQLERTLKDLSAKEAADIKAQKMKYLKVAEDTFKTASKVYDYYNSPMAQAALVKLGLTTKR